MFDVRDLTAVEEESILEKNEDHFFDVKSLKIAPAKLQECFVALANADGGELYVGIEDPSYAGIRINPFKVQEDANSIISVLLEQTNPAVEGVGVEFLKTKDGFVLHFSVPKSPKVHYTASGDCFIRVNAQKLKIKGDRITQLAYSKGSVAYERQPVSTVEVSEIECGKHLADYMQRVQTSLGPAVFLRKQRLLAEKDGKPHPNVGCILLFDDEPQASLDTRCAVKVYRLRTTEIEYKREQLEEMPSTVSGPIEQLISKTIQKVQELLTGVTFYDGGNLVTLNFPAVAIKEILVNAVIHRDYSLNDDIHVRIYDNRIEISSPGKLPGYMKIENLYEERFSRNPNLVRLLHNLPDPVNHDIGEGLDTARNELKKAGLVAPIFEERANAFVVTVRHQRIASLEDVISDYLNKNPSGIVTNKLVRQLSGEDDVNKVKKALQKLRSDGAIKLVNEKASAFNYQYIKT